MTQELFEKAKFGDRFVTRGGQEALFLRLTENSEWRLANFYVKDWGLITVNRENGKCLNGPDIENDIVGIRPSLLSNLDEAAEISDLEAKNLADDYTKFLAVGLTKNEPHPIGPQWMKKLASSRFKAGAEWMAGQGVAVDGKVVMDFSEPADIINRRLIAKLGDALLKVEPGEVIVQIRKK